jgi:hypothetical protein
MSEQVVNCGSVSTLIGVFLVEVVRFSYANALEVVSEPAYYFSTIRLTVAGEEIEIPPMTSATHSISSSF